MAGPSTFSVVALGVVVDLHDLVQEYWQYNPEGRQLVFESPVTRLEKDQDWTGPQPIRTGNLQD